MTPLPESLVVLAVLLAGSAIGFAANIMLPENHRSDTTRTHFAATVSVVATLAALVLGLAISNANTTRVAMMQDVGLLSSDVIRLDVQLRHLGAEAEPARTLLRHFAAQELADFFPQAPDAAPNVGNPATAAVLDQVQSAVLAFRPEGAEQTWRQAQALQLITSIETARWAIAEQNHVALPQAVVIVVTFWLAVLFGTYGLFMPRHGTAIVALVLSSIAVATAILLILEARTPFVGLIHIPSAPLEEAVSVLGEGK